ncbi:hypothetical protein AVEN_223382-1 [Araneus ventricosus]|uniref:Uncharacterized protein n=1 Tax=Araneus ventricosus TaxID=182803 RepID=A0A4Y2NP78_ARAVE|nr:hypothetical protein AVEN_223382-1 [Araneus ventricosus]
MLLNSLGFLGVPSDKLTTKVFTIDTTPRCTETVQWFRVTNYAARSKDLESNCYYWYSERREFFISKYSGNMDRFTIPVQKVAIPFKNSNCLYNHQGSRTDTQSGRRIFSKTMFSIGQLFVACSRVSGP